MKIRHKILAAGLLGIISCGLFPPWVNVLNVPYRAHSRTPAGYSFIAFPPPQKDSRWGVDIDIQKLIIEWVCVGAACGIALVILDQPARRIPPPNTDN